MYLGSIILLSISLSAQSDSFEPKEIQTLFGNKSGFGGYLGLNTKFAEINGQDALLTGGELAFVLNRSLNIGFEGYGMVNHVLSDNLSADQEELYLQMGYGGIHIEPVLWSENVLHLSFPILIGAGGVGETIKPYWSENQGEWQFHEDPEYYRSDLFFVAEPGIMAELNVFRFMRLAAGASYRFTSDIKVGDTLEKDIEGFNANLSLRFGWF